MTIDDDISALVGFGCESFFYGCYTALFSFSMYLMLQRSRSQSAVNRPIFIISVILYLSCSTHFILEFIHFYTVLTTTGVKGSGNETNELIGADLLNSITDFIGELILIYRCWLLWDKNYFVIVIPSFAAIASLGMIVACVGVILRLVLRTDPTLPLAPRSLVPLGLAGFILPLCTNVLVTILIAVRIGYLSPRKAGNLRGARFPAGTGFAAIDVVVETGMLYLVAQLTFVALFAIQHPAQNIVGVIAVQIYGIAPALIIIRVALGLSNTPSGRFRSGVGSLSQPALMQVRIGYNASAFPEPGQRLASPIPMPQIKSKPNGGDPGSSFSSNGIAASV